jgi:putative sigma-54 modulation protein
MLKKFEIQGVHMSISDKLHSYTTKKIGGLERYIPRHARESAHVEVHLKEGKAKNHNNSTCEVSIHLPHQNIVINESAPNMFAAVDIVEAKLKGQLKKYKDTHATGKLHRRLIARFGSKS